MKPCPFCGWHVKREGAWGIFYNSLLNEYVFSHHCERTSDKLTICMTVYGDTEEEVIERWNSRAEVEASESL